MRRGLVAAAWDRPVRIIGPARAAQQRPRRHAGVSLELGGAEQPGPVPDAGRRRRGGGRYFRRLRPRRRRRRRPGGGGLAALAVAVRGGGNPKQSQRSPNSSLGGPSDWGAATVSPRFRTAGLRHTATQACLAISAESRPWRLYPGHAISGVGHVRQHRLRQRWVRWLWRRGSRGEG